MGSGYKFDRRVGSGKYSLLIRSAAFQVYSLHHFQTSTGRAAFRMLAEQWRFEVVDEWED